MALKEDIKAFMHLALPLCILQVGYHLMGFVDTALAGRFSQTILAASGLGTQIYFTSVIIGLGVSMGVDPLVAQAIGAGAKKQAYAIMWQGLYASLIAAAPLLMIAGFWVTQLHLMKVTPDVALHTKFFVWARMFSIIPSMIGVVLRSYLQALHFVKAIIWSAIIANIVNFLGDWVLLFGDAGLIEIGLPALGIPSLGALGLGLSSTFATCVQTAVMAYAIYKIAQEHGICKPDFSIISRIFRVGIPIGLHMFAEVAVFAWVGIMASRNALDIAAHQVAISFATLTFAVCIGFGAATSVQVGKAVGEGNSHKARRYGFLGIGIGTLFMTTSALLFWCWPYAFANLITYDVPTLELAATLLSIAGVFQIVDGIQGVATGALRGAGMTRITFWANIIGHWCIGAPLGYYLAFYLNYGVKGLWWGLTIGLTFVAIILTLRFMSVSKKPIQTLMHFERS